jgi:hypothetical protein
MSTYRDIALLIPSEYRKEIIELNIVHQSVAIKENPGMAYLVTIWKNYVDENFAGECNLCLGDLLKNYKQLLPEIIQLEKEAKLLDAV